jgi:hypothetical protein
VGVYNANFLRGIDRCGQSDSEVGASRQNRDFELTSVGFTASLLTSITFTASYVGGLKDFC